MLSQALFFQELQRKNKQFQESNKKGTWTEASDASWEVQEHFSLTLEKDLWCQGLLTSISEFLEQLLHILLAASIASIPLINS